MADSRGAEHRFLPARSSGPAALPRGAAGASRRGEVGARGRRPRPGSTRADRTALALCVSLPGGCQRCSGSNGSTNARAPAHAWLNQALQTAFSP